jgi:hypothetical protein
MMNVLWSGDGELGQMILLLPAWVNYYKKIPLMSSRGRAAGYWMKSTVGGMSEGTIVP